MAEKSEADDLDKSRVNNKLQEVLDVFKANGVQDGARCFVLLLFDVVECAVWAR